MSKCPPVTVCTVEAHNKMNPRSSTTYQVFHSKWADSFWYILTNAGGSRGDLQTKAVEAKSKISCSFSLCSNCGGIVSSNIRLQKCLIFCDPTHPRNSIFLVSLLVPGHPNFFYEFDYLKSSVLLYLSYFIKQNVIKVNQCYNVSEFPF